jgi:uncharacterized protein YjbJ (UPF0337 family)
MEKIRRQFSPHQKVAILRAHLVEHVPVSDLCDKHKLHPTLFYRWQKAFFENGAAAFESRRSPLPVVEELVRTKKEGATSGHAALSSCRRSFRASIGVSAYEPKSMNKFQIKGNWNEIKGKLKQKYAQLTDDDLMFVEGKEDELLGRLQQRLGKTNEEIRREIEGS